MAKMLHNNDFGNQGLLNHVDELISQCNYLKSEYLNDSIANEYFDWIIEKVNKIKILALKDPRFNWQIIQTDIDNSFRKSNKLISGVNILIDFETNPIYLPCKLNYSISQLKKSTI